MPFRKIVLKEGYEHSEEQRGIQAVFIAVVGNKEAVFSAQHPGRIQIIQILSCECKSGENSWSDERNEVLEMWGKMGK